MSFHVYKALRDHNRHTCICVGMERKYSYFIPMDATAVAVRQLPNDEFAHTYEEFGYPVRRAAEIYLAAPDKEITPKAREHLEAILADPAYAYDSSQFSIPHVIKEQQMATAAKAAAKVGKKKSDSAAHAAAAKVMADAGPIVVKAAPKKAAAPTDSAVKPVKGAFVHKRATDPSTRGRAPAMDPTTRLKIGNRESVKRGYMLEFIDMAEGLVKASKGKGATIESLVESGVALPGAEGKDASWVRTYVTYALDESRGILVTA